MSFELSCPGGTLLACISEMLEIPNPSFDTSGPCFPLLSIPFCLAGFSATVWRRYRWWETAKQAWTLCVCLCACIQHTNALVEARGWLNVFSTTVLYHLFETRFLIELGACWLAYTGWSLNSQDSYNHRLITGNLLPSPDFPWLQRSKLRSLFIQQMLYPSGSLPNMRVDFGEACRAGARVQSHMETLGILKLIPHF